ncbi:MAG: sigma-70 family RNA polymerase sigma factor [Planctomycetes bacterium]|nr:sigma-70 family RNA polymerase sigma factor [Planctomycetota bacterium]
MPSPEQLADLVRAIAPRVDAMALRWCGADAHDGAQEVHRELVRAWPTFRDEAAPTTWAHRIAVRTLARFAERRRRRQRLEPNATQLDLALDEAVVADYANEPFTASSAAERRARVHRAIDALSPALRDAIVLRVVEGLDYRTIAETLELPLGTVKSRIAAATLRLAERLQDLGDDS